jgi:hypothetical protein
MKLWQARRAATATASGAGDQTGTEGEQARQEIISAHSPCETAENGTGARCTCAFDCANYWLRAKGYGKR